MGQKHVLNPFTKAVYSTFEADRLIDWSLMALSAQ